MAHVLVIANETAASKTLLDALRGKSTTDDRFTVVAPVNEPARGYVVYEDTRRASAGRRLEKTLKALREAGFAAQGFVVVAPSHCLIPRIRRVSSARPAAMS